MPMAYKPITIPIPKAAKLPNIPAKISRFMLVSFSTI